MLNLCAPFPESARDCKIHSDTVSALRLSGLAETVKHLSLGLQNIDKESGSENGHLGGVLDDSTDDLRNNSTNVQID